LEAAVKKRIYFDAFDGPGWPDPKQLQHYFLAPPEKRWTFNTGNDSWGLDAQGVAGTEHLEPNNGRIDISLDMWGHPTLGVLLIWSKWGGGYKETYSSKSDLSRLREWVRSAHDTPLPVGLFISYETAWKALKEFIDTDGELPKSIEWVANRDLPPNTFPDP
jgi:hypothetical protein